jgi:hypothetical protein
MLPAENVNINALLGEFFDLQEQWESDPAGFHWEGLKALAQKGAHAYNDGAGAPFHALVLDGVCHTDFHDRFLSYSIEAGFDPFMLVTGSSGKPVNPVISHDSLAQASLTNKVSQRMRTALMDIARQRFSRLLERDFKDTSDDANADVFAIIQACSKSLPLEILKEFAPELAKSRQ